MDMSHTNRKAGSKPNEKYSPELCSCKRIYAHVGMDGWMDGWMGWDGMGWDGMGWVDGWMDGWMDG